MVIWHSCTAKEFGELQEQYCSNDSGFRLINHQHLGDEEEPMDLFEWGNPETRIPVLRSALTVNKELYWRV